MKRSFTLPPFPNSSFELETSIWTGKLTLWKDGERCERSLAQGKPFLVPNESGEVLEIYAKPAFPDLWPPLEINGVRYAITEKLAWYQYAIALLPLSLIFIFIGGVLGAAIGGAIGGVCTAFNLQAFQTDSATSIKYLKVFISTAVAYIAYFTIVFLFLQL